MNHNENFSLIVDKISVTYSNKQVALYDTSFSLKEGTICGLVGVNGSGKSTLFNTILGFITPNQGQVLISNKPVKHALKQSLISYVPQTENVDWNLVDVELQSGGTQKQNSTIEKQKEYWSKYPMDWYNKMVKKVYN